MIISHKHQFIFFKPRKTASTSVQVALAKHVGPEDIVTPEVMNSTIDDGSNVQDYSRNYKGYFNHMRPSRVRAKIGKEIYTKYFKIAIVRNPWDMLVSRYFWNTKNVTPQATAAESFLDVLKEPWNVDRWGKLFFSTKRQFLGHRVNPNDTFEQFLKKLPHNVKNTKYYFDWRGRPLNDFVIRFEHLEDDYEKLCKKIGLPYEPLPGLKTKVRKSQRDYRELYTPEMQQWVSKKFAKEIQHFGYTFDDPDAQVRTE